MIAPRLVVLSDFGTYPKSFERLEFVCARARPGSVALVLRDRDESLKKRAAWGRALRVLTQRFDQRLWVSDRLDLALSLQADGIHLPSRGLSPARVRPWFDWVSRAAHDVDQLSADEVAALSALLISPVFAPRKGRDALGVDTFRTRLSEWKKRAPQALVYALGGVNAQNARLCLTAGAAGVAVIGAALDPQSDPQALLAGLSLLRR